MDYSPSPRHNVKPQYAFLDNSIEIGRGVDKLAGKSHYSSPLKPTKDTETLHERQRKFYSKYQDIDSPIKPKHMNKSYSNTTPSRLFKNIDSNVPIDDDVRISSNMVEKIIRENEVLKQQLKELKKSNDLVNGFANGLKEKLIKYKKLNDSLKGEVQDLKTQNDLLKDEAKIKNVPVLKDVPVLNFDPNNTKDVFGDLHEVDEVVEEAKTQKNVQNPQLGKIEARINSLEKQIEQINDKQDEKFEFIKNEIEFLKQLTLSNPREKSITKDDPSEVETPKEDDLIIHESFELKELQNQVDLFTKKLQIREENKLRKHKLNQELFKLTQQLQNDDIPIEKVHKKSSNNQITPDPTPVKHKTNELNELINNLKSNCDVCEDDENSPLKSTPSKTTRSKSTPTVDERPSVNIEGTRWYQ